MDKTYLYIAIAATAVFVVQMVLTFAGVGDADTDVDVPTEDTTDSPMELFSVRSVINFLLGLGWGGVCFGSYITTPWLLGLVAIGCGLFFVVALLFMMKQVMRLERNGNFKLTDCVGLTCSTYLRIPARRTGTGKVQISIHGSVQEIAAQTDGDALPTGTHVRVTAIIDSSTLLVE